VKGRGKGKWRGGGERREKRKENKYMVKNDK
jgi:hypothetical protein